MLSALLGAGIGTRESLKIAASLADTRLTSSAISYLHEKLISGALLGKAMSERPATFPPLLRMYVEIGESSNSLPIAFQEAERYFSNLEKRNSSVLSSLIYPAFLVIFSIAVLFSLIFFLTPRLSEAIEASGGEIRGTLWALSFIQQVIVNNPVTSILIVAFLAAAFAAFLVSPIARRLPLATIPYLRRLHADAVYARYAEALSAMMFSGSSLSPSLDKISKVFSQEPEAAILKNAMQALEKGTPASEVITSAPGVPSEFRALFLLGEQSNQIAEMMGLAAKQIKEKVERKTEHLMQIASPLLTLLIGLGIGFIVYSMFNAIFEVNEIAF
nr:type II secretion system F family protein [Ruegeria pomeroyi]